MGVFDFLLEMRRPGVFHQQPHDQRAGDAKNRLIEQANRYETKNQRVSRSPEPEVLVKKVKHKHDKEQQRSFHEFFFFPETKIWGRNFSDADVRPATAHGDSRRKTRLNSMKAGNLSRTK
jgi:hypothetical protein